MKKVLTCWFVVSACASFLSAPRIANAVTLILDYNLTGDISFSTNSGPGSFSTFSSITGTASDFTADLGAVNLVSATVNGPAGMEYFVEVPVGESIRMSSFLAWTLGTFSGSRLNPPHSLSLLGVKGTLPTLTSSNAFVTNDGRALGYNLTYNLTSSFSFTGYEISFAAPAGGFPSAGPNTYVLGGNGGISFFYSSPGAGVPFVTLRPTALPVPEPFTATLGLMGLGVLGMATRRRTA